MAVKAGSVNRQGRGAWMIGACVAVGVLAGTAGPGWADDVTEASSWS
jgi:hypothetical protein